MKILTLSNYVETVKNAWDYAGLAHKIRNRRIGIWELGPWKLKQKTIFIAFELCPISVSLMPSLLFLQLNCNIAVHWITVSWNSCPLCCYYSSQFFFLKKKKLHFFFFWCRIVHCSKKLYRKVIYHPAWLIKCVEYVVSLEII